MTAEDLSIEKAIISAIVDVGVVAYKEANIPSSEIFQNESIKDIYEACADLYSESVPINLLSVTAKMRENRSSVSAAEVTALSSADLQYEFGSDMDITRLVAVCRDRTMGVKFGKYLSDLKSRLAQGQEPLQLISEVVEYSETITQGLSVAPVRSMKDIVNDELQEIMDVADGKIEKSGLYSGIECLDKIKLGWKKKELSLIAARPGHGKTAFMAFLADHFSKTYGRVLIFSYEAPEREFARRIITLNSGVTNTEIENDPKRHIHTINEAMALLPEIPIDVVDHSPNINELERIIPDYMFSETPPVAIFLDYAQLVPVPGEKNEVAAISRVTRSLKTMAMKYDVPIIALSQFSRSAVAPGARLGLQHLRGSGSLEQDANSVAFLERLDAEVGFDPNDFGKLYFTWAKNRGGPTGGEMINHDIACNRFSQNPVEPGILSQRVFDPNKFPKTEHRF